MSFSFNVLVCSALSSVRRKLGVPDNLAFGR